jgi:hypothetical protein
VKDHPVCYDGFEPSGRMHIAQGVMRALNVNKLTKVVCQRYNVTMHSHLQSRDVTATVASV